MPTTRTTSSSSKTSPDAQDTSIDAAYHQMMDKISSLPKTASRRIVKNTLKQSYQSLPQQSQFDLFFSNMTSRKEELNLLREEVAFLRKNLIKLQVTATAEDNTDQKKVDASKQNQADVPQQSRVATRPPGAPATVCKSVPYSPTKSQNGPKKVVTSRGQTTIRVDYENQGGKDEVPQVKRSEVKSYEVKSYVANENESSDTHTHDDDALVVSTVRNIKKENIEHDDENNLNKLNVNFVKAVEGNGKKKAQGKQLSDEDASLLLKRIRREQEEREGNSKMKRVTSSRKRKSDESHDSTEDESCADGSSDKRDGKRVVRVARAVRRKTSPSPSLSSSSSSSDVDVSPPSHPPTTDRRRREEAARWKPSRSHITPEFIERHKAVRILTNLTNDIREKIMNGATYLEIEKKLAVDFDRKSVGIRNKHIINYGKDFVDAYFGNRSCSGAGSDLRQKIGTNKSSRQDSEQAESSGPGYGNWPAYHNSRRHSNNSNSRHFDNSISTSSKHEYRNRNLWNTKTSSSRIHYSE